MSSLVDNAKTSPSSRVWKASEMLRIAQEDGEFLGFIELGKSAELSLADLRQRMKTELDNVPAKFNFLLPDGVPVSLRQEKMITASDFLPHLTIRRAGNARGASNKVNVTFNGDLLSTWITTDYTFGQLRKDAARYFNLSPAEALLQDGEGCAWPEQARIESMFTEDLQGAQPDVHLVLKASHRLTQSVGDKGRKIRKKTPGKSFGFGSRFLASKSGGKKTEGTSAHLLNADSSDFDVESDLWRIFTYYCVHGDAKEVEHMRCHHWLQLMRDVRLLETGSASRTPAASFRVIYSAETRGQSGSSGKMNYDEFLNALMNVSGRACTAGTSMEATGASKMALEAAFCELLVEYILPHGLRWDVELWQQQTDMIRLPEVTSTLRVFKSSLYDIFRFYAPATENPKELSEFGYCLGYKDWMAFVQDFELKNVLALSLQQVGEIFLASCHCGGATLDSIGGHPESRRGRNLSAQTDRLALTVDQPGADRDYPARLQQTVLEDSVLRPARNRLYFAHFCDAVLRTALFSFDGMADEDGDLTPGNMIKALFQGLSRTLSRSRIIKILAKSKSICVYPAGLMKGSMSLNAKYLSMWKKDGCCDYLHVTRSVADRTDMNTTLGRSLQGRKKGRRTTMKDISSPMNLENGETKKSPRGHNNAKFSPTTSHQSPVGGTAAFSLESPMAMMANNKAGHESGRSLLAKLLTVQHGVTNISLEDNSMRNESEDKVDSSNVPEALGPVAGGTANNNLLSPAIMGGIGDTRSSAFQPNLLRGASSPSNISTAMNHQTPEDKGYDYAKLFDRRADQLGGEKGRPTVKSSNVNRSPASSTPRGGSSARAPEPLDLSESVGSDKPATFRTPDSSPSDKLHEVFPDLTVEECAIFLKMNDNDIQKCMTLIMDNSMEYARTAVRESNAEQASPAAAVDNRNTDMRAMDAEAEARRQKVRDAQMRRVLQKGFLCYKYASSNGKRQRRYFYVTGDFKFFAWRPLQRGSKDSKRFEIRDINKIVGGNRDGASVGKEQLTLSLELTTRNVDLEFEDRNTRDEVLEAFQWLLAKTNGV